MLGTIKKAGEGQSDSFGKLRIALVGVDTTGQAPGGIATVSRRIISGFQHHPTISILPISNFNEGGVSRRIAMGLKAVFQLIQFRRHIDLVHVQVASGLSIERDLLLAAVARAERIPVIAQFHGAGQIDDFKKGSRLHRLNHHALVRLSHNLALGSNVLDWLRSIDSKAWATIAPNGVDVPESPAPFPNGLPTLVFAGRLGKRKGVFDLLTAVEILQKQGITLRLNLLGDGDLVAVQQRVDGSDFLRDSVSILGWQNEEGVKRGIEDAWSLVLPSYAEGLPMSILEAMALGRAVVATRVGDVEDLVSDGISGLLVQAGDVAGLTEALRRIVTDAEFAQRLGVKGHVSASKNFSTTAMLKKLEDIYLDVANYKGQRG
jgi:glycosyltransferase involved in cell wall biosynthesis